MSAHCDASKERLKIKWRVDIAIAPDDDVAATKPSEWAEQPMMVYIPTDDPKDKGRDRLPGKFSNFRW